MRSGSAEECDKYVHVNNTQNSLFSYGSRLFFYIVTLWLENWFRQMGRSSLAGYLPFENSNDLVMDFASKEIIPLVKDIPIIFGINATDPTKDLDVYIDKIKEKGF